MPISSITAFAEDCSSTAQKAEQSQDKGTSEESAIQIPQEEFDTDSNNNSKGQSNDQTTDKDLSNENNSSLNSNSKEEATSKENASILGIGDNVWVNGKTGDDSNSGTEVSPVKTFEKAKELLTANNADIIWVSGTIEINGTNKTWYLGGKSIMREVTYTGDLVRITNGGTLTLQNIIIDGSSKSGATGKVTLADGSGGSLITLQGDSNNKPT